MKIILYAIIGNEEAVIARFIESFSKVADEFIFVNAIGNQKPDQTISIIESVCAKPFSIYHYKNEKDFPHVDHFGNARQMALNLARESSEMHDEPCFLMWADADDVIDEKSASKIREVCKDDSPQLCLVNYRVNDDKQIVTRERITRADVKCRWQFPIHEQIAFDEDVHYKFIPASITHAPLGEKRTSSTRNMAILENAVADTARNFFYIAQEHFHNQRHAQFLKCADIALEFSDLGEVERYELLMQIAQTDSKRSKRCAAEAFALMPDRREALALLCNYAIIDGQHEKALELAEQMMMLSRPTKTYWTQNNEWYSWKADELYRQCLRLCGRNQEAKESWEIGVDQNRPVFSIIHATLDRPHQALAIREMWLSRADRPGNVQYIFGMHSFDEKSQAIIKGFEQTITPLTGSANNYDTAAGIAKGQIIVQAQDDCYPPQGWDTMISKLIPDTSKPVFVAVGDGHRKDLVSVNTVMTRAYMEIKASRDKGENGFFHRGYPTVFPDTENSYRAIKDAEAGICEYIDAPHIVIYHDHPFFNSAIPMDATYTHENSPENYKKGHELFMKRNPDARQSDFERKEESCLSQ